MLVLVESSSRRCECSECDSGWRRCRDGERIDMRLKFIFRPKHSLNVEAGLSPTKEELGWSARPRCSLVRQVTLLPRSKRCPHQACCPRRRRRVGHRRWCYGCLCLHLLAQTAEACSGSQKDIGSDEACKQSSQAQHTKNTRLR